MLLIFDYEIFRNIIQRIFAKNNEALNIKAGVMDGQLLSKDDVKAVASLPSREQIYAMFAGAVSGIARGLATTINGVGRGLAQTVSQVAEQKENADNAA